MSAIGFRWFNGIQVAAHTEECPTLGVSDAHAPAVALPTASIRRGGGMNPFDEELGETQSVCHQGGVMQVQCYDGYNQRAHEEVSMTMRSAMTGTEGNDADPKIAVGFKAGQSADGGLGDEREVSPTLSHKPSALEPTLAQSQCDPSQMRYIVRRLTPTEAERLMGLPDGWTIPMGLRRYFGADGEPSPELVDEFVERFDTFNAIMAAYEHKAPPKGKSRKQVAEWLKKISCAETCPDSPRYKGCGNSWASNQPRWILTRLLAKEGMSW